MKNYSIAVDGPAGAGKSTIAKLVAKKLNLIYIDTGAMYRAMGIFFNERNVGADDKETIISMLDEIDIKIAYIDDAQHVILNDKDVTAHLREEAVGDMASKVSAIAEVRRKLVALQQELARTANVIMDGRDIGSVVLPGADLKIFLTASVEVRAKRRYDELTAKGLEADLAQISKDIEERDYRDTHRDSSPLICVPDAVVVDTSDLTIEKVTDKIVELFEERRA